MDNAPDLLSKEATLLSGGIAAGIWQRGADIADKPVAAAAAVTATSAITGGLAYAAERFAPEIALTAGKMVLGAAIILEAARGASDVLSAVSDTWHNPHGNAAKDKQLIADSLGKPLVDAAIFGAVGFGSAYAGAKAGGVAKTIAGSLELQATRKSTLSHFPELVNKPNTHIDQIRLGKDSQLGKLYSDNAPSVVQIFHGAGNGNGRGSYATGFIVDDNLIATNNHVLHGHITPLIKGPSGEMIPATLVARDKRADLALLKLPEGALKAKPVTLGTSDSVSEHSRLVMVGHPQNVSRPVLGEGHLITRHGQKFLLPTKGQLDKYPKLEMFAENVTVKGKPGLREVWRPDTPAHVVRRDVLAHNVPAQPGNSGSPIFDMDGKVVGIHSTGGEFQWASSVGHLKALIEVYRETSALKQTPGSWLTVITNARAQADNPGRSLFTRLRTTGFEVASVKEVGP